MKLKVFVVSLELKFLGPPMSEKESYYKSRIPSPLHNEVSKQSSSLAGPENSKENVITPLLKVFHSMLVLDIYNHMNLRTFPRTKQKRSFIIISTLIR